jgi:hypothetical protein
MAKIEKIGEWENINLTASVGRSGVNLKEDVMAVQGLLRYIFRKRFEEYKKLPFPNGSADEGTIELIGKFQRAFGKNRRQPEFKLVSDGRVDAASNKRLNSRNRLWTIVALNDWAFELWLLSGAPNESYINDLCVQFPQIRNILENSVGTLGLSLEPSFPRFGTLGLALE